jgi:hypothetical protein
MPSLLLLLLIGCRKRFYHVSRGQELQVLVLTSADTSVSFTLSRSVDVVVTHWAKVLDTVLTVDQKGTQTLLGLAFFTDSLPLMAIVDKIGAIIGILSVR